MPEYKLTLRAERDVREIANYSTEQWGGATASRYIQGMHAALSRLAGRPDRGRLVTGVPGLWLFRYEKHSILYRIRPFGILVTRILHQSRDLKRHI